MCEIKFYCDFRKHMKTFIVVVSVLLTVSDGSEKHPAHSQPWICTKDTETIYNYVIWNSVATQEAECIDEIMELPDVIETETLLQSYQVIFVIGPYIGPTKTFRTYGVVVDKVDSVDLVSFCVSVIFFHSFIFKRTTFSVGKYLNSKIIRGYYTKFGGYRVVFEWYDHILTSCAATSQNMVIPREYDSISTKLRVITPLSYMLSGKLWLFTKINDEKPKICTNHANFGVFIFHASERAPFYPLADSTILWQGFMRMDCFKVKTK